MMINYKSVSLGIVLAVIPWIVLAATRAGAPAPTIIAIASEGREVSATVASTFSRAPFFIIADLQTSTARAIRNPYWSNREAMGLKAAYLLLDEGVGAVLVKSIRPAIHNALFSRGVHIYDCRADTVLDAIRQFRGGAMADLGPAKLPHHIDAHHIPLAAGPCPCQAQSTAPPGSSPLPAAPATPPGGALGLQVVSGTFGGATVISVAPGSRAARAGLLPGDLILGVGQTAVRDAPHFSRLAAAVTVDTGVMLTVNRAGATGQLWILPENRRFVPNEFARR